MIPSQEDVKMYFDYLRDTLKKRIEEKQKFEPEFIKRLVRQLLEATQTAHERDLIHGDIRTANILIDGEGNAIVSDFGLRKVFTLP